MGAFVLVPAYAAAVGGTERFDAQCDFVFIHAAAVIPFNSRRIRFASPHDGGGCLAGLAR